MPHWWVKVVPLSFVVLPHLGVEGKRPSEEVNPAYYYGEDIPDVCHLGSYI